ncbi:MAG: hypothetical protein N2316_11240 [Spirochaetes bacterium]|nr:hypothetical protein [Spirochaetota bacterium]
MKKVIFSIFILFLATTIVGQTQQNTTRAVTDETVTLPIQSLRTHLFDVEKFSMSFGYEPRGFGEVLTAEFNIRNKTDDEIELYIYAIATYESEDFDTSSFTMPRPGEGGVTILNFVPYPLAQEDNDVPPHKMKNLNFRYKTGNDADPLGTLQKFPRDPKLGINPLTGGPYKLKETLFVQTKHVSKYRKNYVFFNYLTLLIFDAKNLTDEKGKLNPPLFRQVYRIHGKRK